MSLQEVREQNKQKVIENALIMFLNNGIENTKVVDIAKASGLTERSVFRYFNTKADLVLAAAMHFFNHEVDILHSFWDEIDKSGENGHEKVYQVLLAYAMLFFNEKKSLVFVQEAEIYLYRSNMLDTIRPRPIKAYKSKEGPLSIAICEGIEDGSIKDNKNLELFYFNAFDSLLGLLQKMATTAYDDLSEEEQKERLVHFCTMLVQSI